MDIYHVILIIVVFCCAIEIGSLRDARTKLRNRLIEVRHKFSDLDSLVFDRMHATDENQISMGLYDQKQVLEVWDRYNSLASNVRGLTYLNYKVTITDNT